MVSSSSSRRSHTTTYKKKKILIVDDDPDISFSLKKALEEYNDDEQNKGGLFELVVDTFTDPADVVSNYNQPVMYDLLIIDIVMPKALSFQETVSSIREGGQVKSETKVRPLQSITSTVNETLSAKPTKEADISSRDEGKLRNEMFVKAYNDKREHGGINGLTPSEMFLQTFNRSHNRNNDK
jgi:CheY-like chemotaxis protein